MKHLILFLFAASLWGQTSGITTSGNLRSGSGSPEGSVSAPVGTVYQRTDGSTGTSLYIKESGSGNTGWVAVAPSAGGTGTFQALITDLDPSATSTVLTIAAGRCQGTNKSASTLTITGGSGDGTFAAYCTDSQTIVVEHSTSAGLTVSASGLTPLQLTTPAIPEGMVPIATGTITDGEWDTVVDARDWSLGGLRISSGAGDASALSGGVLTLASDPAQVQFLANNYTPLAQFDASGSTLFRGRTGTSLPGTCSVGEEFFDTDATAGSNKYGCTSTNTWTLLAGASSSEIHDTTVFWEEEFDIGYPTASGAYGRMKFSTGTASGSGAITLPPPNGEANHPGILQLSTGATNNSFMSVGMWNQVLTGGGYDLDDTITMTFLFRMNNTSNVELRGGLSCGAANVSPPNDFIGFEKQFADTNFFLNARVSSTDSRVDSTVAVPSAGTWIAVQFTRTSATQWGIRVATGSSALTSVGSATQTTFTPSSDPGCAATPFFQIENNTTADKQMDVDYVRLQISGMTR